MQMTKIRYFIRRLKDISRATETQVHQEPINLLMENPGIRMATHRLDEAPVCELEATEKQKVFEMDGSGYLYDEGTNNGFTSLYPVGLLTCDRENAWLPHLGAVRHSRLR